MPLEIFFQAFLSNFCNWFQSVLMGVGERDKPNDTEKCGGAGSDIPVSLFNIYMKPLDELIGWHQVRFHTQLCISAQGQPRGIVKVLFQCLKATGIWLRMNRLTFYLDKTKWLCASDSPGTKDFHITVNMVSLPWTDWCTIWRSSWTYSNSTKKWQLWWWGWCPNSLVYWLTHFPGLIFFSIGHSFLNHFVHGLLQCNLQGPTLEDYLDTAVDLGFSSIISYGHNLVCLCNTCIVWAALITSKVLDKIPGTGCVIREPYMVFSIPLIFHPDPNILFLARFPRIIALYTSRLYAWLKTTGITKQRLIQGLILAIFLEEP